MPTPAWRGQKMFRSVSCDAVICFLPESHSVLHRFAKAKQVSKTCSLEDQRNQPAESLVPVWQQYNKGDNTLDNTLTKTVWFITKTGGDRWFPSFALGFGAGVGYLWTIVLLLSFTSPAVYTEVRKHSLRNRYIQWLSK
jgi:hypothetical protein